MPACARNLSYQLRPWDGDLIEGTFFITKQPTMLPIVMTTKKSVMTHCYILNDTVMGYYNCTEEIEGLNDKNNYSKNGHISGFQLMSAQN